MTKNKNYFGIEIRKDIIDVCDHVANYYQFKNTISGLRKLIQLLDHDTICV